MHFTAFETNLLLQAIGLSMLHSIWQTAILWLLYITAIEPNKNKSAAFKYNYSLLLLFIATSLFIFSITQHYYLLTTQQVLLNNSLYNTVLIYLEQYNHFTPYIATIYLTAIVFYIGKIVYQMYTKQQQHVVKPTVSIRLFTKQSALLLGIKKNVQIWLCNTIDVPQVKGYIQPIILLPVSIISNLNSKQIEAIVLHELAHVKRNDYLLYIFQLIAKAILLFNPFALLLHKAINKHREYCCDDMVLHFNYNNKEYATALYILETNRQQTISVALAATNTKSGLFNRIKRIIEPSNLQPKNTPVLAYSLLIVCCLSCMLLNKPFIFTDKKIIYNLHSNTNYISENTVNKKVAARLTFLPKAIFIKHINIVNAIGNSTIIATQNSSKTLPQIGLVNKEWMAAKQKGLADFAKQVAEKTALEDADEINMVNLVKIEEEQSGSNNKILYYFEINSIGGKPVITPIYLAIKPTKNIKQKKKTQIDEIAY